MYPYTDNNPKIKTPAIKARLFVTLEGRIFIADRLGVRAAPALAITLLATPIRRAIIFRDEVGA